MSNLSEEEIIKILKNQISDYVIGDYCEKCGDNKICNDRNEDCYFIHAIDGILDLYNKEKEKNKELEQLSENIKMFREKNLSSEIDYIIALKSSFMEYLKEDYISKDKIKEEIKGLENMKVDGEVFTIAINFAKKEFQKLLED